MRRVVITGLGAISPVGLNVEQSWQGALAGKTGIREIESFDTSGLPVNVAGEAWGFDPVLTQGAKEARRSTRFVQLAVAAAKEAMTDAGLSGGGDLWGCSIGVGIGAIEDIRITSLLDQERGPKRISPFFIPYVISNMAAGVVANTWNLRGPNICPTTACASGTHGIGEAWLYIKNGLADVMVCGGSEAAISRLAVAGFANMKALSRRGAEEASCPFDKRRDGFVIGEGAGILVLEDYEHAKARSAEIYGELLGYGITADAHHITAPAPEGEGAQRCMRVGLASAGINAEQITYINAHGTSTPLNDSFETAAITGVFGEHAKNLAISSTKGVTGHCLGAAGGIEAVFLVKAVEQGIIPPTANYLEADPDCHLDYVPNVAREVPVNYGLSNSFGFGGTNACIVVGKKP